MKKLFISIILFVFIINFSSYAEDSKNSRKLFLKSDITLTGDDNFTEEDNKNVDPMNWKDDTRFSRTPKLPQQDQPKQPQQTQTPTAQTGEKKCYYVTSQVTSIRSTPSFLADRIGIYKYGSYICEQNRMGDWINTGTGWVNTKSLSTKNPAETAAVKTESKPAVMKPVTKEEPKPVIEKPKETPVQTPQQAKQETKEQKKQTQIIKYITGAKVNIRTKPDTSSEVSGQYVKNEKVEIIEVTTGWFRTDKGWVSSEYLSDSPSGGSPVVVKQEKPKIIKCMYVSYKKANIRKEPDKRSKDLGDYDNGDKVCFYEFKGDWGRSDKGWVNLYNLKDVKCMSVTSKTLNVRKTASSKAKVVQVLKKGQQVCEYDRKNGWVYTGRGWVSGQYLK